MSAARTARSFRFTLGGVFNNQIREHPHGAVSIPHRAGIPNPFAAVATIVGATNLQAGTALDLQHGIFQNVTAATNGTGGLRVTTSVYAHRALRNLLVFEVTADFGQQQQAADHTNDGGVSTVTVGLSRCGGSPINWDKLDDFNVSTPLPAAGAKSLVVKYMEENCDSGHFCPQGVALAHCAHGLGCCNNTAMPPRPNTEVGLAFEQLPPTLTLTTAQPTRKFVAAIHTSLEPGLATPGAAAAAAAVTLAQYAGGKSSSVGLRQSHDAAWEEEWRGGIEVAGNLTIAS
eukprot:COSAG05_NODE_1077_length_5955_cov_2.032787_7_plen_288_part_00